MRRYPTLALILAGACTAPALLLQREAAQVFRRALEVEKRSAGHAHSHATLCREAAATAEATAYRSFPSASDEAQKDIAEMRKDCKGLSSDAEVADGGSRVD